MTQQAGFTLKSGLRAGSNDTDRCWANRNLRSAICQVTRWPQNDATLDYCAGQNNERMLKECLHSTGELYWFEDFPGCTSDAQCYQNRPAYTKP